MDSDKKVGAGNAGQNFSDGGSAGRIGADLKTIAQKPESAKRKLPLTRNRCRF